MIGGVPIITNILLNLEDLGINSSCFKFGNVTLEGDKYVGVKETGSDGNSQILVIDTLSKSINRKPMKAESALIHPLENILVVRSKFINNNCVVQIFNLDTKEKLGVSQFNENVVYWKWLNSRLLAIICDSSVYHWNIDVQSVPEKVFSRSGRLNETSTQIVGYQTDTDTKWCLLVGLCQSNVPPSNVSHSNVTIEGQLQLFSIEKRQQQLISGYYGSFGDICVDDYKSNGVNIVAFVDKCKDSSNFKLHIMDISSSKESQDYSKSTVQLPLKMVVELPNLNPSETDFPIYSYVSNYYGLIFIITRAGVLYIVEPTSGQNIYHTRISNDPIFLGSPSRSYGVCVVNRKGLILHINLNSSNVVSFLKSNTSLYTNNHILNWINRYGYHGSDDFSNSIFNELFQNHDYANCSKLVSLNKTNNFRTPAMLNRFKMADSTNKAVLQYLKAILQFNVLNQYESVEFGKLLITSKQNSNISLNVLKRLINEERLTFSEDLGDVLLQSNDKEIALKVFLRTLPLNLTKILQCYIEIGNYDQVLDFIKVQRNGNWPTISTDIRSLLNNLLINNNIKDSVEFVKNVVFPSENESVDILNDLSFDKSSIVDIFVSHGRYKEITSVLLDYLKNNKPEEMSLQTKLFEINLVHAPQVSEALFQMDLFTHYDKQIIASLCEKAGLFERSLENYTSFIDIKRVLNISSSNLNTDWLSNYISVVSPELRIECTKELIFTYKNNQNERLLQTIIQVCIRNLGKLGIDNIITLFEQQSIWDGIYYVIGSNLSVYLNSSSDITDMDTNNSSSLNSFIIFKYIEAAIHLDQMQEAERICRDFPNCYDPGQVIEYFKSIRMSDLRPLIWACDLHSRVEELINYLYHLNLYKYIEVYALKINPSRTPLVIGTLIDLDNSEELVKSLLQEIKTLGSSFSFSELIEQSEKRNRLKLLLPWLEERLHEGYQDPALHNALAKIYIDMNQDAENFLKTNQYYDSKAIGDYCEDRDPYLAYIAYRKAWGECDNEIIQVTTKNDLYRLQARYLVERQDLNLWQQVLSFDNKARQMVVDQIISSIIPEFSNKADEISCTIRAFINADIQNSLLDLLEKIVLHLNNSEFANNKNLQNLLLITCIKVDPSQLDDFISRLDNYDANEIAKVALEYNHLNQAFNIYKKFGYNLNAMEVFLKIIQASNPEINEENLYSAYEFAVSCNDNAVWSLLGSKYIKILGSCKMGIDCYIKSENTKDYQETIKLCLDKSCYQDLMNYLFMIKRLKDSRISKDPIIDTELAYCMSKLGMIDDLKAFLKGINTVQLQKLGDRLMDEGLYDYSIVFFQSIPNYSRLTTCYIQLKQYNNALESSKKTNSPKTWKELLQVCMQTGEYQLAYQAGLNIIVYPDYCEDLVLEYENNGLISELIELLEGGIENTDRAHGSLFTELGILYAKYKPEKLMDYCSKYSGRINIPKLIRISEASKLWKEVVYLYIQYHEYDQAIITIITHSSSAWEHEDFINILKNTTNNDVIFKSVVFYINEHPDLLNELLIKVMDKSKLDVSGLCTRIIQSNFRLDSDKSKDPTLIQEFLESMRNENIPQVNDLLVDLYIKNKQVDKLNSLVEQNDTYDRSLLSSKLEKDDLKDFRHIAVKILQKNRDFAKALDLCEKEGLVEDAILIAYESGNTELIENLLEHFLIGKNKESFSACLYTCYEYLKVDRIVELAWKYGSIDSAMPFLIQSIKDLNNRIDQLEKKVENISLENISHQSSNKIEDVKVPALTNNPHGIIFNH